ncbi:hypothetical protein L6452_41837 [Arctium lappa]|uniref:Uncharacterized protein n=1 Tax=Arctium lappa TaxID=4217 RepID=A0ACB8XG61_ARCLA|nr:hypothetical protein L6452_41837 [Arctium lappa]
MVPTRRSHSSLIREGIRGKQINKHRLGEKCRDDEMEKKRKGNTSDSTDSLRKRPRFANLRTRTSPRTLKETISSLSPEQKKKAVTEMGLVSVLKMAIDGVPSKLAFMQIDVKSGNIAITVESVHDLLGLPMGGIDLINSEDRDFGLNLTKEWHWQF